MDSLKTVFAATGFAAAAMCFNGCSELRSIWIPASLQNVYYLNIYGAENGPFNGSGLESFEMEKGSTVIPARLFYGAANLTEVTIPASVTSVGDIAFKGCSRLNRVKFGGNAPAISDSAFSGISLYSTDCRERADDDQDRGDQSEDLS